VSAISLSSSSPSGLTSQEASTVTSWRRPSAMPTSTRSSRLRWLSPRASWSMSSDVSASASSRPSPACSASHSPSASAIRPSLARYSPLPSPSKPAATKPSRLGYIDTKHRGGPPQTRGGAPARRGRPLTRGGRFWAGR